MKHMQKQLILELLKNKIFLALMFLLSAFTSFMYFFVKFSVDKNLRFLNGLENLTENQVLFQNALRSNSVLAANILLAFLLLTGFVYGMFFSRFFKSTRKQLGCLKSLGFHDARIRNVFLVFAALLSLAGSAAGLAAGRPASVILIRSGVQSYMVTEAFRGISIRTFLIGFFLLPAAVTAITRLMYRPVHRMETGLLLKDGGQAAGFSYILKTADRIASCFPASLRMSVRLALRKPVSALLLLISVLSFSILFLLAYSLNLSSGTVYESQTAGRHYAYDTHFETPRDAPLPASIQAQTYLDAPAVLNGNISQTAVGTDEAPGLFLLLDDRGQALEPPHGDQVIISNALRDLYSIHPGDKLTMGIGKNQLDMTVAAAASNASAGCFYLDKSVLAECLSLSGAAYTGVWSENPLPAPGEVITFGERLEKLERDNVSNRASAVINQLIGCVTGCILLYLTLLLNFQDSTGDVIILHKLGYQMKDIRRMLLDIYRPVLQLFFFLGLVPGILIVKAILKSLSLQIGDYMPFRTNIAVIIFIFILLNIIYSLIQASFSAAVRRLIRGEETSGN